MFKQSILLHVLKKADYDSVKTIILGWLRADLSTPSGLNKCTLQRKSLDEYFDTF